MPPWIIDPAMLTVEKPVDPQGNVTQDASQNVVIKSGASQYEKE
jgi:hypothetical protein